MTTGNTEKAGPAPQMPGVQPPAGGRTERAGALTLFGTGGLAALFATVMVFDNDVWWLLASGRHFWQHGLPTHNIFSHAFPDFPWRHTQWLFGAVLGLLEAGGGLLAVEVLQIALVAVSFVVSADTIRRRTGKMHFLLMLPFLLLALSASRTRFTPRPHLVSFLGLALLMNVWERKTARGPILFGLIGLIWGNCHAGVVFGSVLSLLVVVSSLFPENRSHLRKALFSFGAFFAGSLANPNFFYPYQYAFSTFTIGGIVPIAELRSPAWPVDASYFAFSALAVAALPFRIRKRDFLYPLIVAAFLPLSLFAIRLTPKFVLVTLPGIGVTVAELSDRLRDGSRLRTAAFAAMVLSLLGSGFLCVRDYRMNRPFYRFGLGVNWRVVPEGAAAFIRERKLQGRMFNDFGQGGYLIWRLYPEHRVFLDGRLQAYPDGVFREIIDSVRAGSFQDVVRRYGFEFAVVERHPYGRGNDPWGTSDFGPWFEAIGWPMVYLDGISLVYVKPGTVNEANTAGDRFTLIGSRSSMGTLVENGSRQPAVMAAELQRIRPDGLLRFEDFLRFGAASFVAGEFGRSEEFFRQGLELFGEDAVLRFYLATLFELMGRTGEAAKEYEAAINAGGDSPIAEMARDRLGRFRQ